MNMRLSYAMDVACSCLPKSAHQIHLWEGLCDSNAEADAGLSRPSVEQMHKLRFLCLGLAGSRARNASPEQTTVLLDAHHPGCAAAGRLQPRILRLWAAVPDGCSLSSSTESALFRSTAQAAWSVVESLSRVVH